MLQQLFTQVENLLYFRHRLHRCAAKPAPAPQTMRIIRSLNALILSLLLGVAIRVWLLPAPVREEWAIGGLSRRYYGAQANTGVIDSAQVTRTEYFRGFFQPGRSFDQARSRAILAVLQDSLNFRGDTTPNLTHKLVYYDAEGRVLGYTDLDLLEADNLAVAYTEPGGFRRGAVLTRAGRQQLLELLSYAPPFTTANRRRQDRLLPLP